MGDRGQHLQNDDPFRLTKRAKFLLFLFALLVHLAAVLPFLSMPIALDDMYQYDMLARSLSSGNGYRWYSAADVEVLEPYLKKFMPLEEMTFPENGIRTAFRPPGYPIFLSGFYRFDSGANRFIPVRIAQAALFASLTLLVVNLGEAIGLKKKGLIAAGLLMSLYPILLFYPVALASENLFIPLFAWSLYFAWKLKSKPNAIWKYLGLGILIGAAALTRSIAVLILPVITGWLFLSLKIQKWKALLPLITALILIVPWSIRNSEVMGRFAFVENSFWYNMYIGYHPEGHGNFESEIAIKPLFITDDAERDDFCKQNALEFIRADPLEALRRIINRIPAFFGPETREFNYFYSNNLLGPIPQPWLALLYLLLSIPWFFVCLFGVIGLVTHHNRSLVWLIALGLIFYCLPHLPIITEPRFHLALVPLLIPFSFSALSNGTRSAASGVQLKRRKFLIGVIVLLFLSIWLIQIRQDWPVYLRLLASGGNKVGLFY